MRSLVSISVFQFPSLRRTQKSQMIMAALAEIHSADVVAGFLLHVRSDSVHYMYSSLVHLLPLDAGLLSTSNIPRNCGIVKRRGAH